MSKTLSLRDEEVHLILSALDDFTSNGCVGCPAFDQCENQLKLFRPCIRIKIKLDAYGGD